MTDTPSDPTLSSDLGFESDGLLTTHTVKQALEAALLCSGKTLAVETLVGMFEGAVGFDTVRTLLQELTQDYADRGFELITVAEGWKMQIRPAMQEKLAPLLNPDQSNKMSQATLQVLAVIAFKQPVTRQDIEDIRGASVSAKAVRELEALGWIEVIGHTGAPGHPALFATTTKFLDDLGMETLDDLGPMLETAHEVGPMPPTIVEIEEEFEDWEHPPQGELFQEDNDN